MECYLTRKFVNINLINHNANFTEQKTPPSIKSQNFVILKIDFGYSKDISRRKLSKCNIFLNAMANAMNQCNNLPEAYVLIFFIGCFYFAVSGFMTSETASKTFRFNNNTVVLFRSTFSTSSTMNVCL